MKLIVGLGNPGRKYDGTRHNVGWEVLNRLSRRHGGGSPRKKFQAEIVDLVMEGEKVGLLFPQTFMNKSGASVQPARDFYKLENDQIIVVCDDFNLPLGKLRFRPKGSCGGQKGLRDIIGRLGSDEVPRLRIGIGSPPPNWDMADFVLSQFSGEERKQMDKAIETAADALSVWVKHNTAYCMNQYN